MPNSEDLPTREAIRLPKAAYRRHEGGCGGLCRCHGRKAKGSK